MLYSALFILFAVGAAVGEVQLPVGDECNMMQWTIRCKLLNVPTQIPDRKEDLKRDCRLVRDAIMCMDGVPEACRRRGPLDEDESVHSRKIAQFIGTECIEEGPLYQALMRNYECVQPIEKNLGRKCKLSTEDWQEMINLASGAGELSNKAKYCQNVLYEKACIAHMIETQCGQEAKSVAIEILQKFRDEFQYCDEESFINSLRPSEVLYEAAFNKIQEVENGHA